MRRDAAATFGPSALLTPANAVTLARVAAMPVFMLMVSSLGPTWRTTAAWFLISCTDGLDGWLARRQGATRSGAFLDPLADKVVVVGALAVLVSSGVFWWLPVALITVREAGLVLYRSSMARRGVSMPARRSAKIKTVVQDLAVGFALLPLTAPHHLGVARAVLWVAVVLTLVTGVQYLLDGRQAARAV
jgi:CDP-diacylglycerol--glycerol-3-phosphate 3-phosphatidyltransferase